MDDRDEVCQSERMRQLSVSDGGGQRRGRVIRRASSSDPLRLSQIAPSRSCRAEIPN